MQQTYPRKDIFPCTQQYLVIWCTWQKIDSQKNCDCFFPYRSKTIIHFVTVIQVSHAFFTEHTCIKRVESGCCKCNKVCVLQEIQVFSLNNEIDDSLAPLVFPCPLSRATRVQTATAIITTHVSHCRGVTGCPTSKFVLGIFARNVRNILHIDGREHIKQTWRSTFSGEKRLSQCVEDSIIFKCSIDFTEEEEARDVLICIAARPQCELSPTQAGHAQEKRDGVHKTLHDGRYRLEP